MAVFALVQGGGDVGWSWHLVRAQLQARGHQVVAPDLPCEDDTATLGDYADAVLDAVLDEVGDHRDLVVVGHSYGGFTAALVAGRWERSKWEGVELADKTLGIAGLGRIGKLVADRARAFGMRLIAYDPFVSADRARQPSQRTGDVGQRDTEQEGHDLRLVPPCCLQVADVAGRSSTVLTVGSPSARPRLSRRPAGLGGRWRAGPGG